VSDPRPTPASRHGTLSRFWQLRDAVREHEEMTQDGVTPRRARDSALYEALEEIEGSLPIGSTARNSRGSREES
jgi:hypothetical protein